MNEPEPIELTTQERAIASSALAREVSRLRMLGMEDQALKSFGVLIKLSPPEDYP